MDRTVKVTAVRKHYHSSGIAAEETSPISLFFKVTHTHPVATATLTTMTICSLGCVCVCYRLCLREMWRECLVY